MSDSNRKRISVVEEWESDGTTPSGTFGETPATPTMLVLETTGQSMRDQIGYQQSQTIRNDANVKDLIRLSKSAGGGIPAELTYPTLNQGLWSQMQAVLRANPGANDASTFNSTTAGITSGGTTVTRASGSWITDKFAVGDIVKVYSANALNTQYGKVTTVVALTLTLQLQDSGTWAATDANVLVTRGERYTNGTHSRSFSVEVSSLDINKHQLFTGQIVDGMSIQVSDGAITTCNFTYQGSNSTRSGSEAGTVYTAATAGPVLDSIGVPHFVLGGNSYAVKSFSLEITNNAQARTQVGTLGASSIRYGAFTVTGRVQTYYSTFTEMDAFANNTPSDFWFVLRDSNTSALVFSIPQFKWSDVSAPTRGLNQDDYMEGTFQAYLDPTELCTLKMFTFLTG